MRIFTLTIVATLCTLFLGCANPSIVKLSPDTYLLTKEDHAGIFGSMAKLKADVISQANTFAESQGKIAIPIHTRHIDRHPGSSVDHPLTDMAMADFFHPQHR